MWNSKLGAFAIGVAVCVLLASTGPLAQSDLDEQGLRLSLDDALRVALENNLSLKSARVDPEIAAEQITVEAAAFDGSFAANAEYEDNPQDSTIVANDTGLSQPGFNNTETTRGGFSWTDPLNFGASYTVSYNPFLTTQATQRITEFSFQTSAFESDVRPWSVVFEMPLQRGFGKQVNTERLVLARTDSAISMDTLRSNALQVIERVEGAYWDVVAARAALKTAEFALQRAEDLLELNRKKVEVGTLAPIEITQAEAGVASQTEGVIVAEVNLRNAEDELRRLMGLPLTDPVWSQAILTVDQPSFDKQNIDLDAAIDVAMNNRPEIINARREVSKTELSAKVAKKNTRHQLDLRAEIRPQAGTFEQDVNNTFTTGQAPQTIDTTTDSDGVRWLVRLDYSVPLGNRRAKANKRIADLSSQRAEFNLLDSQQTVRVEVRTAVRNVDSGHKRVEAARKNVELQQKKLNAEEKKFENGMSTSFEVLTFQNDLADAELSLIRAGLDYAKSLTAVERAKGTLLDARGLTIEE